MTDTLSGRCACGAVSFAAARPQEIKAFYCHCNDCKKATGAPVSAYVSIGVGDIVYKGEPKTFATSKGVKRAWCETCGTPVSYQSDRWPDEIHFHIAIFDHPEDLAPRGHFYTKYELPWLKIDDDLPRAREPEN